MADLNESHLDALLGLVSKTREHEIACDEFRDRVAEYYETLAASRPLPAHLEDVAQHRRVCPECDEEYDVLVSLEELDRADPGSPES